ncbi:MAG TPA: alpha/beta hydrolase, partial [Gillisia sp.]|nr:alpha/beta hydrolase [Gillisia sp.]
MLLTYKQTELFYTSKGIGNPLVFLHGFLESSKIWEPFIDELSKKRQVICIDLPGHGKSGILNPVHTMELLAEAVHAVLQHLKVEKISLVGHSMGGYVSLAFCEKFPELMGSLVLLNSSPLPDSEEKKKNRDKAIALVRKNKKVFVKMAVSNLVTKESNLKFKDEMQDLIDDALSFSEYGIISALKGMKIRTNKTAVLKAFQGPKYIIASKQDPVIDYEEIQLIAQEYDSALTSLPDGHLSFLENR